ncbi:hypothetical protein FDT66_12745 [Polaribacter aestuariivivens]|uniref:Uncharacterized protein n=1 Tax=Polaribacter aestuariivivens TaxID=2304626 RepID=A0A5S3N0P4_9FLAO|nr:hypothetical protein [Polaribacter aestuariivivens]TMM28770.1 hypothetical protein FDT66_12745 [Polaribacter aestuariivivens]
MSCANRNGHLLSFNLPDYNYDYHTLNKSINTENIYILNKTNIQTESGFKTENLENVQDFFKRKLDNNVTFDYLLKDSNNNLLLKTVFPYEISDSDLKILESSTNFDFIILSKIEYLEYLDKKNLSKNNNARLISALAGAVATVKIIDLKNKEVFLEMSCTASVNDANYHFEEALDNQNPVISTIPVYKKSISLGEKAMKKLLRKIK